MAVLGEHGHQLGLGRGQQLGGPGEQIADGSGVITGHI
jgi:hypothetical protein